MEGNDWLFMCPVCLVGYGVFIPEARDEVDFDCGVCGVKRKMVRDGDGWRFEEV